MAHEAILDALADAQVTGVDAVYAGTVLSASGTIQRCLHALGIVNVPVVTTENACASGTTALHEARHSVESGRYNTVLALGVESMTSAFRGSIPPAPNDSEGSAGLGMPAIYGMAASRYEYLYGIDSDDLALVAVKNRAHGTLNPRAQHQKAVTSEEILASRLVSDPLTLLQCCDIADGTAAAVIGPERKNPLDIRIRGSELASGGMWDHCSNEPWGAELMRWVAERAYEATGVGPEDINVFEVHDAFTIGEIIASESLGLASPGAGVDLLRSGRAALGGATPINLSGGLLSRGHALGATGLAQTAEIVWQLRGEAGGRQTANPRLGLIETMGGGVAGIDGNGCVVAILERSNA